MLDTKMKLSDEEIKAIDKEYCSWGDTVHYHDDQTIFRDCEGSYMYDGNDTPYLDLQMWYSSCNLGYKNKRVLDAVLDQYQTMPQISSRFVYDYKALLAEKIAKANLDRYGIKGRVQFNVGGAQVNEDMLKLIRNYTKNRECLRLWADITAVLSVQQPLLQATDTENILVTCLTLLILFHFRIVLDVRMTKNANLAICTA